MKFDKDDPIYWYRDLATNFYLLSIGEVKLYAQNRYPFITHHAGSNFGDSDALLDEPRDSKAVAEVASELYMITSEDFNDLLG
jgi:CRP-like cAMP-binding protein